MSSAPHIVSLSDAARALCVPGNAPGRRLRYELERRQRATGRQFITRTDGKHRRVDLEVLRKECPELFAAAAAKTQQRAEQQLVEAVQLQLAGLFTAVQEPMVDTTGELKAIVGNLRDLVAELKSLLQNNSTRP